MTLRALRQPLAMLALLPLLIACRDESPPAAQLQQVGVAEVTYQPVSRRVSLTGTVTARIQSDLSFQVSGRVSERLADTGDSVKKGAVLARLDPRQQQADLAAAEAAHEAALTTLGLSRTAFDRQKRLLDRGQTTRDSFDSAQEALTTAESSEASTAAELDTAREALKDTVLRADADGIITDSEIEVGQVVSAAQTAFSMARDGARDAEFDIYEGLMSGAPPKDGIRVQLVSDPAVTARAEIREVSPVFDTATGTVAVKATLIDPPPAMSLGAAITGSADLAPRHLAPLPATAMQRRGEGPALWVIDPDDHSVSLRPVTIARYETGRILVSSGVRDGEEVVTEGGQMLHPGQQVEAAK